MIVFKVIIEMEFDFLVSTFWKVGLEYTWYGETFWAGKKKEKKGTTFGGPITHTLQGFTMLEENSL